VKLDHVTLLTDDLPALLRFYGRLPGITVKRPSGAGYAEVVAEDSVYGVFDRTALAKELDVTIAGPGSGTVILQFAVDDVDESVRQIEAAGQAVTVAPRDMPWGSRSAYLTDPDGNLVELYRW
jgi:predicted enzyme related to lactoylglutathione lyase